MISERVQELLVRARNAFRLRDYETADLLVDQMLEEYPESVAGHILKGIILGRTRRNKEAIRIFRRALELDPVNAEAFNNIAVTLRQEGQLHQALRAVQKAEELFGDRADILYNKGNILKDLGQIDEAIGAYLQALEADDRYVLAYNNLGTLYQARGEINRAIETFGLGLSIDPNHPTLRYNLGLAYEEDGRLREAEAEYARSLKSRPGWGEALNNLGIVYQKQERYEEADRAFREILKLNRKDPRANNNLATNYALQGRTREAMRFYRDALDSDPSYSRAAGNLGQLIDTEKDVDAAVDELQQLAELDMENLELQYRLATALARTGKYEDAERVLLRILGSDARHIEATRLLGDVYLRSGQDEKAERCYRRLSNINADYMEHHLDRARVFQLRREIATALQEIETYLEAKPGDLDGLMLRASIYVDSGRQDDAIAMLEELRKIYPGDGRVLAAIANAHQRGGMREEALRAFDDLINLQGSRATSDDIEALHESLQLYEQAVDAFADDLQIDWERNINRLVELSKPDTEEEEEPDLAMDEQVSLDEDSIPILSFGGEELLELEEWEIQVQDDEEEDEDEYLGVEPAAPLAPSLTSLPEQGQLRGGENFAEGLRPQYDGGSIGPSPAPAQSPNATMEEPLPAPPEPPSSPPPAEQPAQGYPPQAPPGSLPHHPPQPPPFPAQQPPRGYPPQAQPGPQPDYPPQSANPPQYPPTGPQPDPARASFPDAPAQPPPYDAPPYDPPFPDPFPFPPAPATAELPSDETDDEDDDLLVDVPDDFELVEDESVSPEDELSGYDEEVPTIDDLLGDDKDSDESDEPEEFDAADEADELDPFDAAGDSPGSLEPSPDEILVETQLQPPAARPVAPPTPQPPASAVPPDGPRPERSGPAGLLDYLSNMAGSLPDKEKREFMESEVRLKLEFLRAQLAGRRGLHEDGARYAGESRSPVPITTERLSDTLSYIGQMSSFHPDQALGTALKRRVSSVLDHIETLRKNPQADGRPQ